MNEDLKTLHESKNFDEIYNLIETKFSQFESRWNRVLASEEGVKLWRNTKLSPDNRDKIYRKMFAELIVEECASIAASFSMENKRFHPDIDPANLEVGCRMVYFSTCWAVSTEIKQHFGVEE
jgi:hypothetical protein